MEIKLAGRMNGFKPGIFNGREGHVRLALAQPVPVMQEIVAAVAASGIQRGDA